MTRTLRCAAYAALLVALGAAPAWSQQGAQSQITPAQADALKKQSEQAKAMNALIDQAQTAMNARNWQDALEPLRQLVAMDPARWEFHQSLGNVQFNLGNYDEAVRSYENGIKAADATKDDPKDPAADAARRNAGVARMLTNEGNAYLKLKRNSDAVAAYTKAAALDPNPAVAWFNLCATQYNLGEMDAALAACEKAIQADPTRADAYFIKGSVMFGNGRVDAGGKYVVPPGTVESLRKYLELAPQGGHVADVKAMLEALGIKILH